MKKWLIFLLILLSFGNFTSASIIVHNYSIDSTYSPLEIITGKINLTIAEEKYNEKIVSNDNDQIELGDFLNANGVLFECSPPDCSNGYAPSGGATDKNLDILASGKYLGFVISGKNIVINSINFSIESDFEESAKKPLEVEFFEKEKWEFNKFSNSLLEKNWGCYNDDIGTENSLIGNSFYCEMISIEDSGFLKIGAKVKGNDTAELNMAVFPETGTGASWECSFDPNSEDGCIVNPDQGEIFSAGNYQICVGANTLTNYRIYQENSGENCGFAYETEPENSTKDFAIFAQSTKYADASELDIDTNSKNIIAAANDIIMKRYEGDCSSGCILPMEFSGISQNIRISNIQITYTKNFEWNSENQIYNLETTPVTVNFSGLLDLGALGFSVSKSMNYTISINEIELLNKQIRILPAPTISSVTPLNPPAGVPINFYAKINFDGNESLNYKWNFGDNTTTTTTLPLASHAYANIGNYTLSLEVSAGGNLTSKRTFNIETISPEAAINITLNIKQRALKKIISTIDDIPSWYREALSKAIGISTFQSELNRLDRERNSSFSEQEFIKIAKELYALDIPIRISTEVFESSSLVTDLNDINIEPVATISGSITGATNSQYAKPIFNWQLNNIISNYITKKISASYWSGKEEEILRTYNFNINSKYPDKSYFVINRPFAELYFKENAGAKKTGEHTIITLEGKSNNSFEFYYKNTDTTSFFVSPKLSSIIIEAIIDTTCNFNLVCEEKYGENPDTCRSDCKPIAKAIVYVILSMLLLLAIYTILQIWYKHRYEDYLFKDRRQLYNILMYVTNARARGMNDLRIGAELRSKGWSSERINYIIKKSKGERTGLYEIIPIEKITAYFRNRKAKKIQETKTNIATSNQQQIRRNINKSKTQKRL